MDILHDWMTDGYNYKMIIKIVYSHYFINNYKFCTLIVGKAPILYSEQKSLFSIWEQSISPIRITRDQPIKKRYMYMYVYVHIHTYVCACINDYVMFTNMMTSKLCYVHFIYLNI